MNEMGTKRGRPAKYKTVEELQTAIDGYFAGCDERKRVISKKPLLLDGSPYTIEGLCLALDIDRSTLMRYEKDEKKPEFRNTIKRAKLRIQQDIMERGLSGSSNPAVTIFNLKNNFGYSDKQEHEVNGKYEVIEPITGMIVL